MRKIILNSLFFLVLLILISSVSAQEVCKYNGLKTVYDYNYQTAGAKIEYADEKFVHLVDPRAVKNLEQLKRLTCLESADFYNQGVSGDLENLKDLTNLKVLSLHTNPEVSGDVCIFSKATKLKSLKLAFDEKVYGDISCLKDLNLETFAMTYTKINGDLSDFSQMSHLKALYLSGTNVGGDVSALAGLINLEELTLSNEVMDGSRFYGDLASLDNLKKLRKVAIYNTKATNCEHFEERHPNIEGGCSESSQSTLIDPNKASEKIIGKENVDVPEEDQRESVDKQNTDDNPPPKECIVEEKFIGEEKCRALVEEKNPKKTTGEERLEEGPPQECTIDGHFIGEKACKEMMEKRAPSEKIKLPERQPETELQETPLEKTESKERETKKDFLKKVVDWFISLFK